ncbi:MAG: substrate-binding domain-containing protein [Acidimicrobiales bacterium]|jgi:molybdate/tungstate transport system substrate-binding protein
MAAGAVFGLAAVIPGSGPVVASSSRGGPVYVLYAGSLVDTMAKVSTAFDRATGYSFVGFSAGSSALATEIQGETQKADVFVSAGSKSAVSLEGARNGDWVSWYAQFGTTPLLLGYNPQSRFAKYFKIEPWFKVVTMPGFRLGRTDPVIDPKGVLAATALDEVARSERMPTLRVLATETSDVFPEEDLVGRLQAGQLDGAFFFGVEAEAAKIPTVTLGSITLTNPYVVTVVNRAPHEDGAVAFVKFLLGAKGSAILRGFGLTVDSPAILSGPNSAVPMQLRSLVS